MNGEKYKIFNELLLLIIQFGKDFLSTSILKYCLDESQTPYEYLNEPFTLDDIIEILKQDKDKLE